MELRLPWRGSDGERFRRGDGAAGGPALLPLTPEYDPGQHSTYVESLTQALADEGVRNIALTGRYGVGKSSVLSEFAARHGDRVLSLSLSTLGPGEEKESATNQIEKELVKQLLHSRPPRVLPQSRYRRIESLSVGRAAAGSAVQLAVAGGVLWFFGLYPRVAVAAAGQSWLVRIGAALLFAGLITAALTWIRLAVHNRVVSSVSAAGASISLTDKEASYFDKYLDEIVYYFERVPVDVVVFEDLDRFNDPQIFEALRELNSLLNAAGAAYGKTIRFVYALKDSIFERLGQDSWDAGHDAATSEAVRANRTKFFDLVVPMVPFITHRTSRDLLSQLLSEEALVPVSPKLIDLTARHITDMRMLKNIRNEYVVFAARLITQEHGVSKLRADSVFAMMIYKNLHLADFERIQLGRSDLDSVYWQSRELIRQSIEIRRTRLQGIAAGKALAHALEQKASDHANRLRWYAESLGQVGFPHLKLSGFQVDNQAFDVGDLSDGFWRALLSGSPELRAVFSAQYQATQALAIARDHLGELLRGTLSVDEWDEREQDEIEAERNALTEEIDLLRRAGFDNLSGHPDFVLGSGDERRTFDDLLESTLKSEVARDLVRHGYIDQNFPLYVAQYYGDRVSAVAMNFIVQHVQTNKPEPYYSFPSTEDVVSVLRETRAEFLDQQSAYNIAILDHLLELPDPANANTVLDRIVDLDGPQERSFLDTYLSDGAGAREAASRLARSWKLIFRRLIESPTLDDARRLELVSAALEQARVKVRYELGDSVRAYLQGNYANLMRPVDVAVAVAQNAVALLGRAGVVIDDLAALDPGVRRLVIADDIYELTASNLRAALGDPETLSLDVIRAIDAGVFEDCIARPASYLDLVGAEQGGSVTVSDPAAFPWVLASLVGWKKPMIAQLCRLAAKGCRIEDLSDVPKGVWHGVVLARRCSPTFSNVARYVEYAQGMDADLAGLLTEAGAIKVGARGGKAYEEQKLEMAKVVLNSSATIPSPKTRVGLVTSLDLQRAVRPDEIDPEEGHLLGLLLENRICTDTVEVFQRFRTDDWNTLSFGIERSQNFAKFVVPELLDEQVVARLLSSPSIDEGIKEVVVARLSEFVPSDDKGALRAAGKFAAVSGSGLAADQVARIARVTTDRALVIRLVDQLGDTITPEAMVLALVALGAPYTDLSKPGAEITVPNDPHHQAVFNRLRRAGRLSKVSVRRVKPEMTVTVAWNKDTPGLS
ncbi:hypothetical protein [Kribbella speibonae]|uniref:YobI-like P-loop NTPase domain-containing protein n=1 Tax=Kribbella speibonae TaxID=1572660 RepID=A0A4R0IFJ4_9ACTN|nr:hypothetical protein [Kribbella speibonae]TCC32041.1 hypothetical protein E0H92_36700 [Kribbella speibonae]